MVEFKKEFLSLIKSIKAFVEAERAHGIGEVPLSLAGKEKSQEQRSKEEMLLSLRKEALGCRKCDLYSKRKNLVFSDGDADAKLLFAGEAPGFEEDLQGLPFVGRAGKLLTKMIESIGLSREGVYICNVLKCRPPENRRPLPEEVCACRQYLLRQIEIVSPKVICCLGRYAASTLLGSEEPITRLRGRRYDYKGITIIPTFHPAYLLRNPNSKVQVWEDLKKIRSILSED